MVEDELEEFFDSDEERRRFFSNVDEPSVKRERFVTGVNVNEKYYRPHKRAEGTVIETKRPRDTSTMKHIVPGVFRTGEDTPSVTRLEHRSAAVRSAEYGAIVLVVVIVMFLVVFILRGNLMP